MSGVVLLKPHFHTTGNNIEYNGAACISRALQLNTSLKSLDISGGLFYSNGFHTAANMVGDFGAIPIAQALRSNVALQSLVISCLCKFKTLFTQQITKLEILVSIKFRGHSK